MDSSLEGLVDSKNLNLYNSILESHTIEVLKEKRADYLVYSKDDKSIVHVPINDINSASFTHELLHIYLRIKKVFIGACIANLVRGTIVSKFFSLALLEHIGNCLDHIKILPLYLDLGYPANKFISDFSTNKFTDEQLKTIKKNFTYIFDNNVCYNGTAIDAFIGRYFSAIACPNISINYENNLNDLKLIDEGLFSILEEFVNAWKNFDYNDANPMTPSYHEFSFKFIEDLKKWSSSKLII